MRDSIRRAHPHRQESLFPFPSHLEKSQTLPMGQVAMLVPIISKIHSKSCEQHSTSTMGSESHTLLGTSLPLLPATANNPSWLSTETWGLGRSQVLQRHLGDMLRNGSVFLEQSWDVLTAPLCHGSFSVALTGGCPYLAQIAT